MSVRSLPPDEDRQHPATTHITLRKRPSQRSILHEAALKFAEKGRAVLPCRHAHDPERPKEPYWIEGILERGHLDATTDPRLVTMFWNRFPGTSIGVRLERQAVVDIESLEGHGVDGFAQLRELEEKLGQLPRTRTHQTASGGQHRIYQLPEGVELTNRTGDGALAPGVELKVNGYILAPPSPGYSVMDSSSIAELPLEWAEAWRAKSASRDGDADGIRSPKVDVPNGKLVREGGRFFFLRSECGRLHDGTRDLEQLTTDLMAVRDTRCENPDTFTDDEVRKIARSVYKLAPCSPPREPDPERDELVEELDRAWFEDPAKGIGGKTDSSIDRVLLRCGARTGTVIPGVGLRVSISVRTVAEEAQCHTNTVLNYTRRATNAGKLRKDGATVRGQSGAFILLDPRLDCDTLNNPSSSVEREVVGVSQRSHTPASELRTEHYRWRGHVGKGRERALCFLEAFGPMSVKELAQRLGWSRGGDVRRRYLEPLTEFGLVEDRGGLYALAGDHRERSEDLRREDYSTVQLRVARVRSEEGLWVHRVIESGMVESEERRGQLDRARNARQRETFHRYLFQRTPEAEDGCRQLLNEMDEEREIPDGFIRELERIEPETPSTADDALVAALRGFFDRNPHRAGETPSWLSVALWADEFLDSRPPPAEVETALVELMSEAA